MSKYIDADRLKAEIERRNLSNRYITTEGYEEELYEIIDSLQQEQPKVDLVAELKHHLDTTPKEQLEKEWKELEPWGNIGPTVQEFLYGKQQEVDLENEIEDFLHKTGAPYFWTNDSDQLEWCCTIARHFYELGRATK